MAPRVKSSALGWSSALVAILSISFAWWIPNTIGSAVLGFVGAFGLVVSIRALPAYTPFYVLGIVLHVLGFYWLYNTIADFGGFEAIPTLLIFGFFAAASSVLFLIFVFLYRNLPEVLNTFGLRVACAWVSAEFLAIKIFPWYLGHSELSFSWLAQVADIGGVPLISFLMVWFAESSVNIASLKHIARSTIGILVFGLALLYGRHQIALVESLPGPTLEVALIQANISIAQKHNVRYFLENTKQYLALSKPLIAKNRLTIWPEAVIQELISSSVGNVQNDPRLPSLGGEMLIGALTVDSEKRLSNSALAILADGSVLPPYRKQILMPFGEYTPLGNTLPWLREINFTPEFTPGTQVSVFELPFSNDTGEYKAHVAPLICYEDVVDHLSREATRQGADLLVNMTNDAWFGKTIAPYQHHLIAAFRAIENRRFLVRSTNSGLSAVVDPTGKTVASLPIFSDGTFVYPVKLLNYQTLFTKYRGDLLWWVLGAICACAALGRKAINIGRKY